MQVLAEMLDTKLDGGLLVGVFGRAFPGIPLEVALEALVWHRLAPDGNGMSDAEFDALLGKWIADDLANEE
ncbi:hypothetical protein PPSIR1_06076 [Plesiocystis pacifica SIR-1]|uniref:Uncharacterized protein n=1 Tax=Plesiocystis pacifica SIR-1 TaxID=391625 RepID=A6G6U0_9BACT|nr:hypothetical protein PPSIR1_06076 [Plesiocystis pacifica SIR-1]